MGTAAPGAARAWCCAVQRPQKVKAGWVQAESRQRPLLLCPCGQRNLGSRLTSGGRQRRLSLLVYGASTPDEARLESVKRRPGGVRGGPWPPGGPRKPPKRRRTRPGAPRRANRAKGALGLRFRASCQLSNPSNTGPRPTSGGRQQRLFLLVYGASTPDEARLGPLQGRPPGGRSDAARRAYALDSGPGGALSGVSRVLPAINPAHQRGASDLGGAPATIVPLGLWCKASRRRAS